MKPTAVVGYDHTPSSERALAQAGREAAWRGAAVTVVHFLNHRYPGMPVESAVIAGPTADALAEAARDANLLVLGNRGRGGFTGLLLGSVSMRTSAGGERIEVTDGAPSAVLTAAIRQADLIVC